MMALMGQVSCIELVNVRLTGSISRLFQGLSLLWHWKPSLLPLAMMAALRPYRAVLIRPCTIYSLVVVM